MRIRTLLLAVTAYLLASSAGMAQNYLPTKDLVFGQVAVGDAIETVINLTNRGGYVYAGTLTLRKGEAEVWNPLVNGQRIENGEFKVSVQPDQTVTLRIKDTGAAIGGMAVLIADDLFLDNFVEGTLTYYVLQGTKILDSVGVSPSTEFYLAAVPFENFKNVALALANGDLYRTEAAPIRLDLLTEDGNLLDSKVIELLPFAHSAKFLKEIFPGLDLNAGKLEVFSLVPIFGTALTLTNGELSSLPLKPSPVAYTVRMVSENERISLGELSLWAEDFFVKGYLVISNVDGQDIASPTFALVSGELIDGVLKLTCFNRGEAFYNEDVQIRLNHSSFGFESAIVAGTWVITYLSDDATEKGTFELERTTP